MERIFDYRIPLSASGLTITQYLKSLGYSRHILTLLKQKEGSLLLNQSPAFTNVRLKEGDHLHIRLWEDAGDTSILPAPVPFSIVWEDEDLLVVNKPADTPIHPSMGNRENTLANGVLFHYSQLGNPFVYRCINRLDRDTTGLLIIAKNALSGAILSQMMKDRQIRRTYLAIVKGIPPECGTIDAPIGRVPGSLLERQVDFLHGETAVTHFQTLQQHKELALVQLQLETGRTHQIRVHMGYLAAL